MENSELHRKLISVARQNPPSDSVPYAFEKRIMAHLAQCKALDPWALWSSYFSRAAVCSIILVAGLSFGARFIPDEPATTSSTSTTATLSQEFEQTVFAAVDSQNPEQEIQ